MNWKLRKFRKSSPPASIHNRLNRITILTLMKATKRRKLCNSVTFWLSLSLYLVSAFFPSKNKLLWTLVFATPIVFRLNEFFPSNSGFSWVRFEFSWNLQDTTKTLIKSYKVFCIKLKFCSKSSSKTSSENVKC